MFRRDKGFHGDPRSPCGFGLFGCEKVPELKKGALHREFKSLPRCSGWNCIARWMKWTDTAPLYSPLPVRDGAETGPDAHAHGSERPPEQKGLDPLIPFLWGMAEDLEVLPPEHEDEEGGPGPAAVPGAP